MAIEPLDVFTVRELRLRSGELLRDAEEGRLALVTKRRRNSGSVVAAARCAAELGATAMHDPTEDGLAAGLDEPANASRVTLSLSGHAVELFAPGLAVCRELGADP